MARGENGGYICGMSRPRLDPDRVLTPTERSARRYERHLTWRRALEAIVAARSITKARKLALDALAARGVSARDRGGAAAE